MKTKAPTSLLLLLLMIVWQAPCNLVRSAVQTTAPNPSGEQYDPALFKRLQSVDDLLALADEKVAPPVHGTLAYFDTVNNLVQRRFYHGYSHYGWSSNPVAAAAGRLVWNHLSAIVLPDDILKHPMAACSQQALVLMEVFRRNNIPFRKVGFDHHYAVEAFLEGQWRFFDPNKEPELGPQRPSLQGLLASGRLYESYPASASNATALSVAMANPYYGPLNCTNADNARLFHCLCFAAYALSAALLAVQAMKHVARQLTPVSDCQPSIKLPVCS